MTGNVIKGIVSNGGGYERAILFGALYGDDEVGEGELLHIRVVVDYVSKFVFRTNRKRK